MKAIISLILFIYSQSLQAHEGSTHIYAFTSNCVNQVEVKELKYAPTWGIIIHLNEQESDNLSNFSKSHISTTIQLTNGEGLPLLEKPPIIREPISSPFHISGIKKEQAEKAKALIFSSKAKCGLK